MGLNKTLHAVGGYVVIRVQGRFLERFLNVCTKRNIYLWDITRLGEDALRCKVSLKGFRILPVVARKTHCRVRIVAKCGLPIAVHKYKKRKWFLAGIGVFLLLMLSLNLYVWKIDVVGNEKIPTDILLAELDKSGVRVGQFRFRLDEKSLQNEIIARVPQLSWLWINKQGSRVVVQVKEREMPPEVIDPSQTCDLVAKKAGVIHNLNVRAGQNLVAAGDTVQEGAVLVSGTIETEGVGVRTVHADGEVLARTWYEKTQAFSLVHREQVPTGNTKTQWGVSFFGHPFWFGKGDPFAQSQVTKQDMDWAIGNTYLGVTIHKNVYHEVTTEETPMALDDVVAQGADQIQKEFAREADSQAKFVKADVTHQQIDEETVEVTVIAEYIENIAKKVRIDSGTAEGADG